MAYDTPSDIISKLINISCASINIKELILKEKKDFKLRPQLHFMLLAEAGNIKSTILKQIAEIYNITPYISISFPGLVGTIYKTGDKEPIVGCAWESRNKLMILDEFNLKEETMLALLRILEDQHYKRQLGVGKSIKYKKKMEIYFLKLRMVL